MSIPPHNSLICMAASTSLAPLGTCAREFAEESTSMLGKIGWRTTAIIINVAQVTTALLGAFLIQDEAPVSISDRAIQAACLANYAEGGLECAFNVMKLGHTVCFQQNERDGYIPLTGQNSVVLEMDANL